MSFLSDVQTLLEEVENDRKKRHADVDEDCNKKAAAIATVQTLLAGRDTINSPHILNSAETCPPGRMPTPSEKSSPPTLNDWPGLRKSVRDFVSRNPERFTLDDVVAEFSAVYPNIPVKRIAVSQELWRINHKKEIQIIRRGSGRTPHIYKKGEKATG